MKSKLLPAILSLAAVLTVNAAPSSMDRVKQELQPGGELYLVIDSSSLHRHIAETYIALERGVAESSLSKRDSIQSALVILRAFNRLVGIPEIAALGASSTRDAEFGFSNRVVIAAETEKTGWLWRMHGKAEPRLARIAALPADTALALDFSVDFRPILKDIRESGCDEWLSQHCGELPIPGMNNWLESVSGDWQIVLAIPEGGEWNCNNPPLEELKKCDIYLSIPDNNGSLKNALEVFCAAKPSVKRIENVTYVSSGNASAMVFVTLDKRILFFSSIRSFNKFCDGSANVSANGRFVPGAKLPETPDAAKVLAGEPGFAAAVKRLPENSNGAYFISSDRLGKVLTIGGRRGLRLRLPNTAHRSIGIWRAEDGMIVRQEISTEGLNIQVFDALVSAPLKAIVDLALNKTKKTGKSPKKQSDTADEDAVTEDGQAQLRAARRSECLENLRQIRKFIAGYSAKNNGKLPPKLPDKFTCGGSGYIYFAPFAEPPSGKMPLVADNVQNNPHPGTINVIFVDGSIESFEFESDSIKRLCSFLHTIYRYDEREFIRLIERASQLDAGKGN